MPDFKIEKKEDTPNLVDIYQAVCYALELSREKLHILKEEQSTNIEKMLALEQEITALDDLGTRLYSILNQRSWYQFNSDLQEDSKEMAPRLRQSDINDFNKKNYIQSLEYTRDELVALYAKLGSELYRSIESTLFSYTAQGVSLALSILEKDRNQLKKDSSFETVFQLPYGEEKQYSGEFFIYDLAAILKARYIIHSQNGALKTTKGFCAGDIYEWFSEIGQHGKSSSLASADINTYFLQKNQLKYRGKLLFGSAVHDANDNWRISRSIVSSLKSDFLYSIDLRFKKSGHLMGIRKIPGTSEIEFRDPNYGTFVFENDVTFQCFFNYLVQLYKLIKYNTKAIQLYQTAPQPQNATSSIPNIIFTKHNIKFHSLEEFETLLQGFSYSLLEEKNSTKKEIETYLTQAMEAQNLLLKKLILSFFKQAPSANIRDSKPSRLDSYHQQLKDGAISFLEENKQNVRRINSPLSKKIVQHLEQLIEKIYSAQSTFTLMSLVDYCLKNEAASNFDRDFIKHYEINPARVWILQEKILYEVLARIDEISKNAAKTQTSIPSSINAIREALIEYANNPEQYPNELIDRIQLIAAEQTSTLGRLKRFRESKLIDDFFQILQNIKPFDPHSLNTANDDLIEMGKSFKKQAKPFLTSWLKISLLPLGIGTAAGFGGFSLGAIIGSGLFPIVGTIVGALVGLMVGRAIDSVIANNSLRSITSWAAIFTTTGAGAVVGALIGSLFPGLGTVIGAFLGGFIGWGISTAVAFRKKQTPETNRNIRVHPVINPIILPVREALPPNPEPAPENLPSTPNQHTGGQYSPTLFPPLSTKKTDTLPEKKASSRPKIS